MEEHNKSDMEKAEGSRENVNLPEEDPNYGPATEEMERGSGQESQPDKPIRETGRGQSQGGSAQPEAGITNRPIEEERKNQADLPPRGQSKNEQQGRG